MYQAAEPMTSNGNALISLPFSKVKIVVSELKQSGDLAHEGFVNKEIFVIKLIILTAYLSLL